MPKFLFKTKLTDEGLRGTIAEGGTARRDTIKKLSENLGGRLEAFYYAFGDTDVYSIVDAPDANTAAAASIAIGLSGAASVETVVLIEPEDVDEIARKTVDYRPPGG